MDTLLHINLMHIMIMFDSSFNSYSDETAEDDSENVNEKDEDEALLIKETEF